jgi:hypothetical protein
MLGGMELLPVALLEQRSHVNLGARWVDKDHAGGVLVGQASKDAAHGFQMQSVPWTH